MEEKDRDASMRRIDGPILLEDGGGGGGGGER